MRQRKVIGHMPAWRFYVSIRTTLSINKLYYIFFGPVHKGGTVSIMGTTADMAKCPSGGCLMQGRMMGVGDLYVECARF